MLLNNLMKYQKDLINLSVKYLCLKLLSWANLKEANLMGANLSGAIKDMDDIISPSYDD